MRDYVMLPANGMNTEIHACSTMNSIFVLDVNLGLSAYLQKMEYSVAM